MLPNGDCFHYPAVGEVNLQRHISKVELPLSCETTWFQTLLDGQWKRQRLLDDQCSRARREIILFVLLPSAGTIGLTSLTNIFLFRKTEL